VNRVVPRRFLQLSPEDIKKLEATERDNKTSE
jgi:hypothetical protein